MVGLAHADSVAIERSVLLWCMRVIGDSGVQGGAPHTVCTALARLGAADAAAALARFIGAAGRGAVGELTLHPVAWRGVSRDEHVLLDVLSLAQQGRSMEALLLLRGLLGAEAARQAADSAAVAGAALARAGWLLDPPDERGVCHYALSA
jgi:hypothetical protein